MMLRRIDIHCPNCGAFKVLMKETPKACTECGSPQAISLSHRDDIDARFRAERQRYE